MTNDTKPPFFAQFLQPHYKVTNPDRVLNEADLELLAITVEDYRYLTREVTGDLSSVPAEIRARATILRRLLSDHDLFRAGKVLKPERTCVFGPECWTSTQSIPASY